MTTKREVTIEDVKAAKGKDLWALYEVVLGVKTTNKNSTYLRDRITAALERKQSELAAAAKSKKPAAAKGTKRAKPEAEAAELDPRTPKIGTVLTHTFRDETSVSCTVVAATKGEGGELEESEGGALVAYKLKDGRLFGSPSGAAKALDQRINGWVFWGLQDYPSKAKASAGGEAGAAAQ